MGTYKDEVMSDNPALYLPCDEQTGGYANLGSDTGTPTVNGVTRGVIDRFGGTSGFGIAAGGQFLSGLVAPTVFRTAQFTIEYWMKQTQGTSSEGVAEFARDSLSTSSNVNAGVRLQTFYDQGRYGYGPATPTWKNLGPSINDGEWRHFAVVADGSYLRVYTDGVYSDQIFDTDSFAAVGGYYLIGDVGGSWWNGGFRGELDDIAIYPKVLTPERIAAHYQGTAPAPDAKPLFRGWGVPL